MEVGDSNPCFKAKERDVTPNSEGCTSSHAHMPTLRRKRSVTNHAEIGSAWGAWPEQQKAALQDVTGLKEDQLVAPYSPGDSTDTRTPRNRNTRASSRLAERFSRTIGTR